MILFRYIGIDRFMSSFKRINDEWRFGIRFNSPLEFNDPWEGLGNGLLSRFRGAEKATAYYQRVKNDLGEIEGLNDLFHFFNKMFEVDNPEIVYRLSEAIEFADKKLISCWYVGEDETGPNSESLAMWNLYASNTGFLIGYKKETILNALDEQNIKVNHNYVRYRDLVNAKFSKEDHKKFTSLYFKDNGYSHEKEYRFIMKDSMGLEFRDIELPVPEYCKAHPELSDKTIEKLNSIIEPYGTKISPSKYATQISRKEIQSLLKLEKKKS